MAPKAASKPAATPAATAATAATERSQEAQLAELLNPEAGMSGEYELKVHRAQLIPYTYPWQGKQTSL